MNWITDPQAWIGFLTLAALEIVLGIDNIIFISILVAKLPDERQDSARKVGLLLAMGTRVLLLFSLSWVMHLSRPLFTMLDHSVTGRDLVLIIGGLFLVWKSTREIHEKLEGAQGGASAKVAASYAAVLVQIAILDVVFSLDSVITAVGMSDDLGVMVSAVVVAVGVMMVFAKSISDFVHKRPSLKILALAFLIMIGGMLIGEGFGHHIPKGYVYFSMAFSVFVEVLNIASTRNVKPVDLREPYAPEK